MLNAIIVILSWIIGLLVAYLLGVIFGPVWIPNPAFEIVEKNRWLPILSKWEYYKEGFDGVKYDEKGEIRYFLELWGLTMFFRLIIGAAAGYSVYIYLPSFFEWLITMRN